MHISQPTPKDSLSAHYSLLRQQKFKNFGELWVEVITVTFMKV